jgi:hypothetical protein
MQIRTIERSFYQDSTFLSESSSSSTLLFHCSPDCLFTMTSKTDAAKGVPKVLRILHIPLFAVYFALSIAYVVVSHTVVAGVGIIPFTISAVLSLSELGILDRVLPKRHDEYNILLGDDTGRKQRYKLPTPWRACLDIILAICLLLILIFMIIEMTRLPYYWFGVASAFLGSYCTMPLLLAMLVSPPLCPRY